MNTPSTKTFQQINDELEELIDQEICRNTAHDIPDDMPEVEQILELLIGVNTDIDRLDDITFEETQTKLDYRQKFNQYLRDNFFNPTQD